MPELRTPRRPAKAHIVGLRTQLGLLASIVVAASALAQIQSNVPPTETKCGSVVVIKCEPRKEVESPNAAAERALKEDRQRRTETRLSTTNPRPDLGVIIIEGERIRPLTVEESLKRAIPDEPVAGGTHTYSIGEGAQCTCMNVCPPWWTLMPCCSCTDRTGNRMSTAPGSTPLR